MADAPNILFLMADQHRWNAMGCAGDANIRTPNLDALAASGVRFSQACTPTPICAAARHSLITGHRSGQTRWVDNDKLSGPAPELPTIMTLLHDRGYRTHAAGNLFFQGRHCGLQSIDALEGATVRSRIDDDYLMYLKEQGIRDRCPRGVRALLFYQPQTSGLQVEHSPTEWITRRSLSFLRDHVRHRGNQPFLLWTSWLAPHPPFAPPEPYDRMYDPAEMELPLFADRPLSTLPQWTWSHRARMDGAHLDEPRIRRIRALYYGMISQVDDGIGRLLRELETLGLAENTVVVYCSDHGELLGDHGLSQKFVPFEGSVRIPLLLRWPGRTEAGRVCDDLVGLDDLLPTFTDGVNLDYPADCGRPHGQSLISEPGGGLACSREGYVIDYGQGRTRWLSWRDRQFKFNVWAAGGREELYDLLADPEERKNLVDQLPGLAGEFRHRLLEWERLHGLGEHGLNAHPEPSVPLQVPPNYAMSEAQWASNLPEEERDSVESYAEAFTRAIAKETTLCPEKLSLRQFKDAGGDLTGTPWEQAWHQA